MGDQNASVANTPSRSVLIADPDPVTLITLEQLFEEAGFDTITTWNILEVFPWLENKRFDLIVVGDHPPELDAYFILQRLETIGQQVPCIVMRAARVLPNIAKLTDLVTSVPRCSDAEILKQARRQLRGSHMQITQAPSSRGVEFLSEWSIGAELN